MSTAELGLSLAEMIRRGHVDIISCTGANLEEDLFNLVAHDHYERIPDWRQLSPADEQALLERGMNRVTDTCIPEEEAFRRLEQALVDQWTTAEAEGRRHFPHDPPLGRPRGALPDRPEGLLARSGGRARPAHRGAGVGGLHHR
jgi:deoxyhypusine synthase